MAVIPDGALEVSADGRSGDLRMRDLAVIDQPRWPAHDAEATPAILSYRVLWTATGEPVAWRDPVKQYAIRGFRAGARLEASVFVPSTGFRWTSAPLDLSSAAFGIIGEEQNGRYFVP